MEDEEIFMRYKLASEYDMIKLMLFKHRIYATATALVKVHWNALKLPKKYLQPVRKPAIDQTNNIEATKHWMYS